MRTRIWLPENTNSITLESNISIKGRFTIELIDVKTQNVKQRLEFDNLITNSGLNRIGTDGLISDAYLWLEVGTGTTPASFSDTALESPVSPRTNNTGGEANVDTTNTSPPYHKRRITRVFNESQANGNLTELGFWTNNIGGILVNRSLMLDSAGNSTIVHKTPSDRLIIVFEYRIYPPPNDVIGTITIDDVETQYTLRPQGNLLTGNWGTLLDRLGNWHATGYAYQQNFLTDIGSINNPSGGVAITSGSFSTYITDSFYRDMTINWGGSYVPETGVGLITFSPWNSTATANNLLYQMMFTPKISKNSLQTLKFTFRISWGRS